MMAVQVTATLDTPLRDSGRPIMLDAILAWAAVVRMKSRGDPLPPITHDHAPDIDIPLTRWEEHGTWGWCTSEAHYGRQAHSTLEIRRKPADHAHARYTTRPRNHHGLGPGKARDTQVGLIHVPVVTWEAVTTDIEDLRDLLTIVTHVGGSRAIGLGHVTSWTVTPSDSPDGWRDRPMPAPGTTGTYRPPYWHASRRVTV